MRKKLPMRTPALLLCLGALSFFNPVQAQKEIGLLGIHFQVGIPQGAFATAYDPLGYGGGMEAFFRLDENLPVYAGVNFSLMRFESYRRRFSVRYPSGFDADYRMKVSSNLFSGFGGIRIMPGEGRIRPYGEGLIGFKNFYRVNQLQDREPFSLQWEDLERRTHGYWTLGYGGSAGILYFLDKGNTISLDVKCSFLAGGSVRIFSLKEHIDPDQFEADPFSAFTSVRSVTPMLIPQIGLTIRMVSYPDDNTIHDFTQ